MIKIGDLIKVNTGHLALVTGIEYLYPSHPQSPPRNFEVEWINDEKPEWAFGARREKINAFSVSGVVSRA